MYLGKNGIQEQDEFRCDCYAFKFYELPFVFGGEINIGGRKAGLGLYKKLLQASIDQNKPGLWNISDTQQLRNRIRFIESLQYKKVHCDSLVKVNDQ